MSGSPRDYDVIVFGASGFTGKFVAAECLYNFSKHSPPIKWAVAGRSKARLEAALEEVEARGPEMVGCARREELKTKDVEVVIADTDDKSSLVAMCSKTKLLLNCVGPYRYLGEPVVQACIEAGTDYMDVCGEPEFLEKMELKYDALATKNKCVVVGACGFDSVPADLGVQFARKQFAPPSVPASIETFLSIDAPKGYSGHVTTYECAVAGMGNQQELRAIRKEAQASKPSLKRLGSKLTMKTGPFRDPRLPGEYCFLFPGADASVIKRTEERKALQDSSHVSFHHGCYFHMGSWTGVSKMVLFGGLFTTMARYEWGRSLLMKYPGLFSCGAFSMEGATMDQLQSASFSFRIFATGYSETPKDAEVADKEVEVLVKGPDPGYIGTSRMLVQLALCTLLERASLPEGGVMTPGFAFENTTAMDRLSSRGLEFERVKAAL